MRRTDSRHCASWMASEQDVVVLPVCRNVCVCDDPKLGTLTDTTFAACTGLSVSDRVVVRTGASTYRRISISGTSGPRYFGAWVVASRSWQVVVNNNGPREKKRCW